MVSVTGLPASVNVLASASDIGVTSAVTVNAAMAFLIFKASSIRLSGIAGVGRLTFANDWFWVTLVNTI